MSEKVKVAVIGLGYIGEQHLLGLAADSRADIVAIAEVKPDLLAQRQSAFGVPRGYVDYHELLEKESLDGVIVATPDEIHRDPAVAAASRGLPLFLEKPIATTAADAEAIVAAVERGGGPCLINFGLRKHKPYALAQARFAAGDFGLPVTAYAKRACDLDEAWRLYGRCSVNEYLGVHDIDYLLYIFGRDVKSIYTVKSEFRVYEQIRTADHYWNVITWKNGATATVLASWAGPLGAQVVVDNEMLIYGTHGSVQMAERWAKQEGVESWTAYRFATETGYEEPQFQDWASMDSHFLDVIQGLAQPVANVYDGLNATRLVIAGEESAHTGQPVAVDLVQ